ncbi:hypothetical protein AB0H71_31470 [Nocardia sp. NPDC050697]|uniref:hypothetical protein n=1 Tax=Nocardia sp. NPDC050697 TaxID=3155158 RepID=UPI0033CE77BE
MNVLRAQFRLLALAFTALAAAAALTIAGASGSATAGVFTELKLQPGTSSGGIGGAVVRGDSDTYILEARSGQLFTAGLGSVEDNAVFTLIAPDGTILAIEETYTEVWLPLSGDYVLDIAPTRGNTEYYLQLEIL